MKNKTLTTFLLVTAILSITTGYAQKRLQDGFVILKNGDTLQGKIDYRNWEKNPAQIQFENAQGTTIYKPSDIRYFEVPGQDSYESHIVTKDMRPLDVNLLSEDEADILVTDTAFLRVLVIGSKVKLYELVDFKPHFFIQRIGEEKIEELQYKKYISQKDKYLVEKNIYRNQLTTLAVTLNAPTDITQKIQKSHYTVQDIRSITRLLNGEDANTVKSTEAKTFKSKKQFLVGAGVQFYSLKFTGDYSKYAGMNFGNGPGPVVNIAYDIFGKRNEQRMVFRFELSYTRLKFEGSHVVDEILDFKKEYTYTFEQNSIIPGLGVLYHFVNTKKLRVYAGLGVAYAFSSYPVNSLRTNNLDTGSDETKDADIEPENAWLMANAMLGARIHDKINIGLTTKLTGAFYKYSALGTKYFPVGITVGYIFNSEKKAN